MITDADHPEERPSRVAQGNAHNTIGVEVSSDKYLETMVEADLSKLASIIETVGLNCLSFTLPQPGDPANLRDSAFTITETVLKFMVTVKVALLDRIAATKGHTDLTWPNALIVTAQEVTCAVQHFVEVTLEMVHTNNTTQEDKAIGSVRAVAASIARLLSAARMLNIPANQNQNLSTGAKLVAAAITNFVVTVDKVSKDSEDIHMVVPVMRTKIVGDCAHGRILKLEKELERERKRLLLARTAQKKIEEGKKSTFNTNMII